MSSAAFQNDLLMFGDLLAHLRQQGFRIGVDHYLRLQQLLDRVGDTCAPEELRTLLCPIFATSRTQQEQFYKVFDSYFALFHLAARPRDTDESLSETRMAQKAHTFNRRTSRRKWLYALTPVALAALIIGLVLFLKPKTSEQTASTQTQTEANANVSNENVAVSSTTEPTPETLVVTATESPAQQTSAQASSSVPPSTPTPTPTPEQSFYQRHQTAIQTLIILSPLIIFLLYEWYRFARRKLLLQKQHARKPPLVWPIKVDVPEDGIYDSEQFLTAARLLRRRQQDEYRRLDVEATVAATIERLGFPDFRYKSDSRVPEYLVLIDRASYRDHQARLFDELTRDLEREGVFVVRYFFDGDPRVSFDESGASVAQLTELQNRYGAHRLLIFGNGGKMLDQITGRLDAWTAIFQHWQDRALLTIEPPARWGLREIALAQLFIVLPATLNGLLALVDHFETTMQADLRSWVGGDFESAGIERSAAETIAALRRILGEDVFQWLAACAVYTELQWNLTLYLGSLPSMPARLLTETNLLKLIRLPWFRRGAIPDEVRWLLIKELTPERQRAVRAALIELLERDPAPPETFASDQYRLNLFAQRWLQSRTHKRLRELMRLVKQLPRSQVLRDLTLIRFLESARRSPLDFLLPNRLRKLFYQRGVPTFGLKTGARFLFTLFFVGIVWIGIRAFSPKTSAGNPVPDLVTQNLTPSPSPTPVDSETPAPQDTAPQPETTLDNQNTAPPANSSPLPNRATNTVQTNSDANQQPGTLISSSTESGVTSVPPVAPEPPVSNPPPPDDPNKLTAQADQLTAQKSYDEALDKYMQALVLYRAGANRYSEAVVLNNIGTLYTEIRQYHKALDFYNQSLAIKQQIGNREGQAIVLTNIGRVYERMGEQEKAQDYYNRARLLQNPNQNSAQNKEPATTQPTPTPAPKPNAPVSMGVLNGKAVSLPKPDYPREAIAARASGRVVVQVTVDETGKVIAANAETGPQELRKPAVDAAYKARFSPTLLSGVPVKVTGTINYDFTIKQPPQPMPDRQRPGFPGQKPPPGRP